MNTPSASQSLQRLLEGNRRFVENRLSRVELRGRREEVAHAQAPFAAVLGCSDSRVPVEIIFDCTLGDLFVVRTAGHVVSPSVVGSLEFATHELHVLLIVVLGHTRCGAIRAASDARDDEPPAGSIGLIVEGVRPAIQRARALGGDTRSHAVTAHVQDTVAALKCGPVLGPLFEQGALNIVGAQYDLDTGEVRLVA